MKDIILKPIDVGILARLIRSSVRKVSCGEDGWVKTADCGSGNKKTDTSHRLLKMCKAGYVETDRELNSGLRSNRKYRPTERGKQRLRIHMEIHGSSSGVSGDPFQPLEREDRAQ